MATEFGSGGCSKKRRTDEEGEQAAEEDRISALPEALQLHILGLLPLKSAIRTGALSTQWRGLWTRRWPAPASLDFRLAPHDSPQPLMESLERRGRRRLDRFSLSFQIGQLNAEDFKRCLGYAAACAVADLDVYLSNPSKTSTRFVNFPLPPFANPHLARLSLTGIRVGHLPYYDSRPYPVLEVIHLHRVTISDETLFNLVAACPLLRTLDIRYCELRCAYLTGGGDYLKNLTIVECDPLNGVFIDCLTSLRSFRYSGAYLAAYEVPTSSPIDDLYICFGGPAGRWLRPRRIMYDARWRLCKVRGCWLDTLISLSSLSVLTLCSSALRRVSAKARSRSIAGDAASCRLLNLREVQLLMFATYNENMDDIMAFLVTCCTPLLERLFVQLPTRSDQYKPEEEPSESEEELSEKEPSESEEELSEVEASEEDQSEQKESEEGSEEDHAYENESDEDGPEEDHSQEYDSEEDHSQGDSEENHSEEDDSEEDYSQKGDSEESHSQEDESEEQGSEEDHPKENGSEEQEFAEAQSKEDGSKREFSDGGQSAEEPLGDCWENLMLLKMTNFMGHHNEMELVSFVLKKSACLNQLILFTPERVHPGGPQKDHPSTSSFLETKLLALEKASPNAQIILSAPDVTATKPFHSETFVKV